MLQTLHLPRLPERIENYDGNIENVVVVVLYLHLLYFLQGKHSGKRIVGHYNQAGPVAGRIVDCKVVGRHGLLHE